MPQSRAPSPSGSWGPSWTSTTVPSPVYIADHLMARGAVLVPGGEPERPASRRHGDRPPGGRGGPGDDPQPVAEGAAVGQPPELRRRAGTPEREQLGDPGVVQVDPRAAVDDPEPVGPDPLDRGVAGRVERVVHDLLDEQGRQLSAAETPPLRGKVSRLRKSVQSSVPRRSEVEDLPFSGIGSASRDAPSRPFCRVADRSPPAFVFIRVPLGVGWIGWRTPGPPSGPSSRKVSEVVGIVVASVVVAGGHLGEQTGQGGQVVIGERRQVGPASRSGPPSWPGDPLGRRPSSLSQISLANGNHPSRPP